VVCRGSNKAGQVLETTVFVEGGPKRDYLLT
jgi:hypothetical protein